MYPLLYLIYLSVELNEANQKKLILCSFYYFYNPFKLLEILEHISTTPLNPQDLKSYIEGAVYWAKSESKGFSSSNKIFNQLYIDLIENKEE